MKKDSKKGLKKWIRNLIVILLEIIMIVVYFSIGGDAIIKIFQGDLVSGFDAIITAIWFLNISILVIAILCFTILKTKFNILTGIWNIIWFIGNIYLMYPNV
jgi:hypothetical protein